MLARPNANWRHKLAILVFLFGSPCWAQDAPAISSTQPQAFGIQESRPTSSLQSLDWTTGIPVGDLLKDSREESDLRAQWAMAWAAEAMLVVAVLQAVIGALGLFVLWRTINLNRAATNAAVASAALSRDALKHAESVSNRELRAYISVMPNFIENVDPNRITVVRSEVKNHGPTPAIGVLFRGRVSILPFPLPADLPLPPLGLPATSKYALFPGQTITHRAHSEGNLDVDLLARAVRDDGFRIYVHGTVEYDDGLGNPRMTNFCRSIEGNNSLQLVARGEAVESGIQYVFADRDNDLT